MKMKKGSMTPSEFSVLRLLKASLVDTVAEEEPALAQWQEIDEIARRHAVLPLVMQGAFMGPKAWKPPEEMLKAWKAYAIGTVLRNERFMLAQDAAVSMLQAEGIPCAILKGASVARLYPKPELRALGDIDLLVNEEQCERAAGLLARQGYHRHEAEHAFHIGFQKAEIYLELHYRMTEFPDSAIGGQIMARLSGAVERATIARMEEYAFPVPAEADQALSLLLHMERHMVGGGIGLRQLCDWRVFIGSLSGDLLEREVLPAIRESGLYTFARILTRICVRYLGLEECRHAWCMEASRKTADELLRDILHSGNVLNVELERAASSFFVKGEESAEGKKSMLASAAKNLTRAARKQFPISKRIPILLPLFWLYIPLRYWFRSVRGDRPKQSVRKIATYAIHRKKLYRKLKLFKG